MWTEMYQQVKIFVFNVLKMWMRDIPCPHQLRTRVQLTHVFVQGILSMKELFIPEILLNLISNESIWVGKQLRACNPQCQPFIWANSIFL